MTTRLPSMGELHICLSSLAQAVVGNCVNLLTDLSGIWASAVTFCSTRINGTGMVGQALHRLRKNTAGLSASAQLLSQTAQDPEDLMVQFPVGQLNNPRVAKTWISSVSNWSASVKQEDGQKGELRDLMYLWTMDTPPQMTIDL